MTKMLSMVNPYIFNIVIQVPEGAKGEEGTAGQRDRLVIYVVNTGDTASHLLTKKLCRLQLDSSHCAVSNTDT